MTTIKKHFLSILVLFLCFPVLQAQYGYGNGNYGRRQSAIPRTEEPEKKIEPKTAEQIVESEMPHISEALDLNEFENAIVRSTLIKYVQEGIELQLLKLGPDKTKEGIEKIALKQNEELKAGLPEEKYEKLVALQKEGYNKIKRKKKEKKPKE